MGEHDEPLARRLSRLGSSGHVKVGAEQPDPDELAKAEQAWRWRAEHPRGINLSTGQKVQLRMLLAEYDRRGKVEQAATTLVEEWEAIRNPADKLVWTIAEQLTERLAAAVRTETP